MVAAPAPPVYTQSPQSQYWYYCQNPAGYYPSVPQCPTQWLQVAPQHSRGAVRRGVVPRQRDGGLAVEAGQPVKPVDLEAGAARIGQLGEQHAALDERDSGVQTGRVSQEIAR